MDLNNLVSFWMDGAIALVEFIILLDYFMDLNNLVSFWVDVTIALTELIVLWDFRQISDTANDTAGLYSGSK